MPKRKRFSRFWCPKDSEHIDGIEVCEACKIPAKLCRVKRNLRVF